MRGIIRGTAPGVAWNPADKAAAFTLSDNNYLGLSSDTNIWAGARATKSILNGPGSLLYAEFGVVNPSGGIVVVGVSQLSKDISGSGPALGVDATAVSVGYRDNGQVRIANVVRRTLSTYGNGAVIGMAVDTINLLMWFSLNGNYPSGDNPATGAGGFDLPLAFGDLYPATTVIAGSNPTGVRLRTKLADFTYSPPTHFVPWDS
jgi:hypothetical protein